VDILQVPKQVSEEGKHMCHDWNRWTPPTFRRDKCLDISKV